MLRMARSGSFCPMDKTFTSGSHWKVSMHPFHARTLSSRLQFLLWAPLVYILIGMWFDVRNCLLKPSSATAASLHIRLLRQDFLKTCLVSSPQFEPVDLHSPSRFSEPHLHPSTLASTPDRGLLSTPTPTLAFLLLETHSHSRVHGKDPGLDIRQITPKKQTIHCTAFTYIFILLRYQVPIFFFKL